MRTSKVINRFLAWYYPKQLMIVFVALQLFDVLTTCIFLRFGIIEANPMASYLLVHFSQIDPMGVLLLWKAIFSVPLIYYMVKRRIELLLEVVNFVYLGVVLWNLLTMVKFLHAVRFVVY